MRHRLDEEAAKQLMALPHAVRRHVYAEILRLAENPAALSRPAAFPHPLEGQLFDTKLVTQEATHYITIMFKYSANEEFIDIAWLMHRAKPAEN